MPFPIATLTGTSATGDTVSAPGCPTVLVHGMPVACVGDAVAGAACTGTISSTSHPTMLFMGRPVASITSMVTGVNPATGAPVSTPVAVSSAVNILV